jgi:hypothetical protein
VISLIDEPLLGTWGLYLLASRRDPDAPSWPAGLLEFYGAVCQRIKSEAEAVGRVNCDTAFGELAIAAWNAPFDVQAKLFKLLVESFAFMAETDVVSSELWLLGAHLNIQGGQGSPGEALVQARRTVEEQRRLYISG